MIDIDNVRQSNRKLFSQEMAMAPAVYSPPDLVAFVCVTFPHSLWF